MNEAFRPIREQSTVVPIVGRRRSVAYVVIIAMAAGGAVAAWSVGQYHRSDDKRAIGPTPALTVTVARPAREVWPITLEASGAIAAWQEASIGAQVGGYRLVDVFVNVGDQVTKGQVLARFDRSLLQADLARLEANDEQAKANEKRMLSLQKSGTVSDRDVLQFVTQARTAGALWKRTTCSCSIPTSSHPTMARLVRARRRSELWCRWARSSSASFGKTDWSGEAS